MVEIIPVLCPYFKPSPAPMRTRGFVHNRGYSCSGWLLTVRAKLKILDLQSRLISQILSVMYSIDVILSFIFMMTKSSVYMRTQKLCIYEKGITYLVYYF